MPIARVVPVAAAAALIAAPGALAAGFSTAPRSGPASNAAVQAALVRVSAARHPGFDRVVFRFAGARPAYRVRYVPRLVQDGSGRVIAIEGTRILQVTFTNARAHTLAGHPTAAAAVLTPHLPRLRQVRRAGDFEGVVTYGLGLKGRAAFRVVRLASPDRIAIDVRR